ncbi:MULTISPECIES: hypothetical protein [Asaia]|uniref:Uncharacterized protein n=1 Tax=Asaia bogorensis TaxID=91915 RepID=A0A060QD92_9PROT|nr:MULTISPECIES: hypothetical protein [Asaia]ETC99525.1 hypothetical protein P792_03580 [Asaia sp. SF2.1]CDG38900.1 hypothetical protein ASAP_0855 [Asaia bogorensis]
MSYRIVYDQVAVKFTAAQLAAACPSEHGREDYFMLFELGGANNMWDCSGARARSWDLIGADREWVVMRKVVEYAASCEGGGMRFANARSTQAETYIRKNRSTLERALTPEGFSETGIGVSASIRVTRSKLQSWQRERLRRLEALMTPQGDSDYALWELSPLRDPLHAALFFAFHTLDERAIYSKARVHGPSKGREPVLRLVSPNAFAAREAA